MAIKPTADRAHVLAQDGLKHLKTASYDAALEAFAESAKLYAEIGDIASEATQRMIVADIYCASGQPVKALATYQSVHDIFSGAGNTAGMASTHNNMGLLLTRMQRYDEAIAAFKAAMHGFDLCAQPQKVAEQLGNLGSVCRDKHEYAQALEYYQRAMAIFLKADALDKVADQHANIGYIHAMNSDINAALTHFELARALYEQTENPVKTRHTVKNIELLKGSAKDA